MPANRDQLYQYKGGVCCLCKLSVQEEERRYGSFKGVFELNHVDPSQKHSQYENLIRRNISKEQLDEVDKCILMCCNCHRRAQGQDHTAEVHLSVTVEGRRWEQLLRGILVTDDVDRRRTFLTNERLGIIPYRVQLGSREPTVTFAEELDQLVFEDYIPNLRKYGTVTVRTLKGEERMRLGILGEREYRLSYHPRFPLFCVEVQQEGEQGGTIWVRNGVALLPDGSITRNGTVSFTGELPECRAE